MMSVAFVQTRDHIVHPQETSRECVAGCANSCSRLTTALGQPGLDIGEPLGVEQLLQHRTTFLGAGTQKGREVALGEQDNLNELFKTHPQDVPEHHRDLVVARATIDPARHHQFLQDHLRRDRGLTDAALLRS